MLCQQHDYYDFNSVEELGSFRTPLDLKWLVQREIQSRTFHYEDWRRPFDYEVGSVRRVFETQLLPIQLGRALRRQTLR